MKTDPKLAQIIDLCCDHWQISREELQSSKRSKLLSYARFSCWFLAVEQRLSLDYLALYFGKSLGNVKHGIQCVKDRCDTSPMFKEDIEDLRSRLTTKSHA